MAEVRQCATFRVDSLHFGIDVMRVQEIISYHELTSVPMASPVVRGLINLRGQIVTAIDLRRRLGLPERPDGVRPMNVVVRTEGGAASLLVDEIGDVLEVSEDLFERPPGTLDPTARELILGAYKLEGRLLLVLDTDRALQVDVSNGQEVEAPA